MGVFYEVRVHLAENADDFVGKKGTTVSMGIRKVRRGGNKFLSFVNPSLPPGSVRLSRLEAEESHLHCREGLHVRLRYREWLRYILLLFINIWSSTSVECLKFLRYFFKDREFMDKFMDISTKSGIFSPS